MVKFIIDSVSDAALESQLIDGYGIEVRYRVEDPETSEILQTGIYEVKVGSNTCGRTMGQPITPEFKALWTRRLIYFLFDRLREFTKFSPLPKGRTIVSGDDYAWWNSIPADWMQIEITLGK